MSELIVPMSYQFKCDRCNAVEVRANRMAPDSWSKLTLRQSAFDFQGAAVADGSITCDFCGKCRVDFTLALNAFLAQGASIQKAETDQALFRRAEMGRIFIPDPTEPGTPGPPPAKDG